MVEMKNNTVTGNKDQEDGDVREAEERTEEGNSNSKMESRGPRSRPEPKPGRVLPALSPPPAAPHAERGASCHSISREPFSAGWLCSWQAGGGRAGVLQPLP